MTDRNALRAGIFIIVSIILILAVIFSIRGFGALTDRYHDLTVVFDLTDDIGGLRVGDEVRIGGYNVGTVEDIDVVPAEPEPRVSVRISVPQRYSIRNDAKVRVQSTVTGVSVLNFESLGQGEVLEQGDLLTGRASILTELSRTISDASPRINAIMSNIELATADVRQNTVPTVNTTLQKISSAADRASELLEVGRVQINPEQENTIGHTARGMMAEIRDVFGDTKTDIRTSMRNVASATGTINEKLPGILDDVDALLGRLDATIAGVNETLVDVKETVANAKELSASARSILASNRSRIDGMIDSLKKTGDNLKFASAEIRRSPWRLLYKPGPNEMANLNLFDSARAFAEGANDLADATGALRDALHAGEIDDARLKALLEQLDHTFQKFTEVERKLWQDVKE